MDKKEVIAQLENALSYSEHCRGGLWEKTILKEAVEAALDYLDPDSIYLLKNLDGQEA